MTYLITWKNVHTAKMGAKIAMIRMKTAKNQIQTVRFARKSVKKTRSIPMHIARNASRNFYAVIWIRE